MWTGLVWLRIGTGGQNYGEDERGGACSTNERRGTRIGCWWESLREGGH
jgi:hypothetical protein